MAWTPNTKKGVDLPAWEWLNQWPGYSTANAPGCGCAYDGSRYLYYLVQSGTTSATTASTTTLYRYDTWNEGWQFLATTTSGTAGMDLEIDNIRNVLYIIHGASLTSIQVFNLNATAVTIANQSCAAFTLTTLSSTVLPVAAAAGSSLTMPDDLAVVGSLTANGATATDSGIADTGCTTTSIVATPATGSFGPGLVGQYVRFTSGTQNGNRRVITAVTDYRTMTTAAFAGAPSAADTFVVEVPEGTSTGSNTTTTLNDTGASWTTNYYANSDVIIISGLGSGQRRRIASNTGTALTLAAAVTGNARTGTWTTTPDNTSVYRIVPSSDFLYYQVGGGTGFYRLDVVQTTGAAWSGALGALPAATGGGANTVFAGKYDVWGIVAVRGAATATVYRYGIGTNAWTTLTTFPGGETFTTGASAAMLHGRRRLFIQKEGSQRCMAFNLMTGILEPMPLMPYAAPGAVDGHRARHVVTPDGVEYLYIMRAGGPEFFRVPLEWLI